jgi:nitrile hydratase subunit alpha
MSGDHGHDHDHGGGDWLVDEEEVVLRVSALEALLVEKGLLSTDAIDSVVAHFEDEVGPQLGAKVVARAWTDPAFRERLLEDATAACAELGIAGLRGEHLRVVENAPDVQNVVVCTLCSCYPWPVLGLPPAWYKSPAYRARVAKEPREVLAEDFGFPVDPDVTIRVWDSNSELRYFVLPERPTGTEGMSEDELAALVTRESMLGVAPLPSPGAVTA